MSVENFVIDLFGTLPVDLLISFSWTRLLHIRNLRLFWILMVAYYLLSMFTRYDVGPAVRLVYLVVSYMALPFFLSDERPLRKLLVVALANMVIMAAEAVGMALWMVLTGESVVSPVTAYAHPGEYVLLHVVHLLLLFTLFAMLYVALTRPGARRGRGIRYFLWFPIMQTILVTFLLAIRQYLLDGEQSIYFGSCALALLCLAADVSLFLSMDGFERKIDKDECAAALQQRLDAYLLQFKPVAEEMAQTAKVRHDFRNQVQVAIALSERGLAEEARVHLMSLRRALATETNPAALGANPGALKESDVRRDRTKPCKGL